MFLGVIAIEKLVMLGVAVAAAPAAARTTARVVERVAETTAEVVEGTLNAVTSITEEIVGSQVSQVSSALATSSYFEKRTIWDWWANGLTGEERQILLGWGYSDTGTRYTLVQLKNEIEYRERKLLTAMSQGYIRIMVEDNENSSGDELRRKDRVVNCSKSKSPAWKGMNHYRGDIKTNGRLGDKKRFYQWDNTHNDIEVYDRHGKHLGSMDPWNGRMYKGPVSGRSISHLL